MTFSEFRDDVLGELDARKIGRAMVDFVNVGGSLWTTMDDFETLESCLAGNRIASSESGGWVRVPRAFAVVLKDGRWLHYHECPDHTYSKWQLTSPPARAANRGKVTNPSS